VSMFEGKLESNSYYVYEPISFTAERTKEMSQCLLRACYGNLNAWLAPYIDQYLSLQFTLSR
jgi:predicted transcriptional regulator